MLALLSTALLVAVALFLPAILLLLTVPVGSHGARRPTTRTVAAVGGALVAAAALGLGALLGAGASSSLVVAALVGGSLVAWAPVAREWDPRGLAAWALGVDAGLAYLGYAGAWTLHAGLGLQETLLSVVLWVAEACVLLVGAGLLWNLVDVLGRGQWRRRHRQQAAWGRPVRRGGLVAAAAAGAVGCFVAFASPVGSRDLVSLPHRLVQDTRQTPPSAHDAGPTRQTSSPSRGNRAAVPGATASGATASLGSPAGSPFSSPANRRLPPSLPLTTAPARGVTSTSPTRTASSGPTGTPSTPAPTSAPTSSPTSSPTSPSTSPTTQPTSHPTHPRHPTGGPTAQVTRLWHRLLGLG